MPSTSQHAATPTKPCASPFYSRLAEVYFQLRLPIQLNIHPPLLPSSALFPLGVCSITTSLSSIHCLSFACLAGAVRHLIASLIRPCSLQTLSLSSLLSLYDLRQTPLFADTKRTGARNTNVTSPEQPRNNAFTIIGHPRPMTCCAADPLARLLNISPSSQMRSSTRMALLCLLTASELLPQHV